MRVLITAALERELRVVRQCCQQPVNSDPGLDLDFLKTGIGLQQARKSLKVVLRSQTYTLVLNLGTAGSLTPEIEVGDIFVPYQIGYLTKDDMQWESINFPLNRLQRASHWKTGALISSQKPIITRGQKDKLIAVSRAQVVDMEAFALNQLCQTHTCHFLTLKVISDIAELLTIVKFRGSFERVIHNLAPAVLKILKQVKSLVKEHGRSQ